MDLKHRLSLFWRRFSPLEERLLEAVRGALPIEAARIFDVQVRAISRVQRNPGWTEIAFYRMRRGRVDWSGIPGFPRTQEFPVAEVRFRADGTSYKARLSAIGGHIFDFGITPASRRVAFSDWDEAPVVTLLSDVLDADAAPTPEPVPEAWRRYVDGAAAREPDGWTLHELETIYRVTLDEGEFLLLAERDGREFLLYRLDPAPGDYFLQRGAEDKPAALGTDFSAWPADVPGSVG